MDEVDSYLSFFESTIVPAFPDQKRAMLPCPFFYSSAHTGPGSGLAEIERPFPPPRSFPLPPAPTPTPPSSLSAQMDDLLSALYTTPSSSHTSPPPTLTHHAAALIGLSSAELSPLVATIESLLVKREYAVDGGKERKREAWEEKKQHSAVAREERWAAELQRRDRLDTLRDDGQEVVSD